MPITLQIPSISVIIQKKQTHTELLQYLHTAYLSTVKSTFEKAIKQHHFKTWPGLTTDILDHLPKTLSTVQGHMHQKWQNLQSTKPKSERKTPMDAIWAHFNRLKAKKKLG